MDWTMYLKDMCSALFVMPYIIKKVFNYFFDVTKLREIDDNLSLSMYF